MSSEEGEDLVELVTPDRIARKATSYVRLENGAYYRHIWCLSKPWQWPGTNCTIGTTARLLTGRAELVGPREGQLSDYGSSLMHQAQSPHVQTVATNLVGTSCATVYPPLSPLKSLALALVRYSDRNPAESGTVNFNGDYTVSHIPVILQVPR